MGVSLWNDEKVAVSERMPLLLLPILIGVVQIVCYYLAALFASPDGAMPVPQPDTLLYCQAARRIAEGFPFSFSEGTAPSTGTTSILYPFVLAIPYKLGFTGDSLISAGFWLNAICYLAFLFGWSVAICNWVRSVRAKYLALFMLGCFGHPAYAALAQSDIGLWMAVSALMLASLSARSFYPFALLLAVAPWVRPEGIICGVAYFSVALFARKNERDNREIWLIAPFILSAAGVFALNYSLTGEFQFSSIAHKGYFKQMTLHSAICSSFLDFVSMFREIVLSLSSSLPRVLISLPVLGGVLLILGVYAHDWRCGCVWRQVAWLVACFLGFASVAQSQWQNTNMDRYLAWIMPLLSMFIAEGTMFLPERFPRSRFVGVLPGVVALYSLASSVVCCCVFSSASGSTDCRRSFARACNEFVRSESRVAAASESGIVYFLDSQRMKNIDGIYSPEFKYMGTAERMEDLKHNVEKRFDYWVLGSEFGSYREGEFSEKIFGPCLLAGPNSFALHKADWSAYDSGATPPPARSGESLVARLDVGYPPDEMSANYEIVDRYSRPMAEPFLLCSKDTSGRVLIEAGRIVAGGDSMDVQLEPGRDVRVVMRSIATAKAVISGEVFAPPPICGKIPETFSMNVAVDGQIIEKVTLKCDQKWFSEAEFVIPGSAITKNVSRISLLGDHIPCGYWFYQKK